MLKKVKSKTTPTFKNLFIFINSYLLFIKKHAKNNINANVVGNSKKLSETFPLSKATILL